LLANAAGQALWNVRGQGRSYKFEASIKISL